MYAHHQSSSLPCIPILVIILVIQRSFWCIHHEPNTLCKLWFSHLTQLRCMWWKSVFISDCNWTIHSVQSRYCSKGDANSNCYDRLVLSIDWHLSDLICQWLQIGIWQLNKYMLLSIGSSAFLVYSLPI